MKIGCCITYKDSAKIRLAKELGFDFIETGLSSFDKATVDDVAAFQAVLDETGLPCPAVNCFFPGYIRLTGENADFNAAKEYMERIFELVRPIGIEQVVFGSGGSRKVPEGFAKEKATEQLITFCRDYVAPTVGKFGITCCIEELNKKECNIVNSCAEAMEIVRAVDRPEIRLLVDLYHVDMEAEPVDTLVGYAGYITHVHIASAKNARAFPAAGDGEDYARFFGILRRADYKNERISIEGSDKGDFVGASRASLACLKAL